MSLFSGLGRALGLSTSEVKYPEFPAFPETQFAQATQAQSKASNLAADINERKRKERLGAQMRGSRREMDRVLAGRGMQRSGYSIRTLRELQNAGAAQNAGIEEQKALALANAQARFADRTAQGGLRYDLSRNRYLARIAEAKQRSAEQQRAGRLGATLGGLGLFSNFVLPNIFGSGQNPNAPIGVSGAFNQPYFNAR